MGLNQGQINKLLPTVAEAANEPYRRSQQTKIQQMSADAKLAELIKGQDLKQQSISANQIAANAQAKAQGLKPGKYSQSISEGGYSNNPENENLAALLGLRDRERDREDRAVERFSGRVSKEKIPERASDIVSLETSTKGENGEGGIVTNPEYKAKSTGLNTWLPNAIRGPVVAGAEKLGFMEKGASAEMQALQRLYNSEIKSNSGTAVSAHEQGRNDIANGVRTGDSAMIQRGVTQIRRALEEDTRNVEGSVGATVKSKYRSQGGEYDVNQMLGGLAGPKAPLKIRVSNGSETLEIDAADLPHAQADGYKVIK